MIHYIPLEHIDLRYTTHLDQQITNFLVKTNAQFVRYYPNIDGRESAPPKEGQFLNSSATIEFKMSQMALIAQNWDRVQDGDIFWFSDLWFPGIESIAYMSTLTKKKIKIRGLLHAGSFTDTDFVRLMERWAHQFENAVFDIVDKVYVGSEFMKNDVCQKRLLDRSKVVVTGFPLDLSLKKHQAEIKTKSNLVIFNGRLCDEKQPWMAELLNNELHNDGEVVFTQKLGLSKPHYYELLKKSKCVVSFALQENFGFGILEATALGCIPVVPNRLVYPELYSREYLYDSFRECVLKVKSALRDELPCPSVNFYEDAIWKWFQ